MKKFKHLSLVLMASALGLSSCSVLDFFTGKGVVSVEISSKIKNVYDCSDPFKLKAEVEVKKDTDKSVTWSSSDEKVAKVDKKGVVTPIKPGKVEITATSVYDTKKSDSLKITVLEGGEHKSLILEGYDYSANFPEKEVNEFAGIALPTFETKEGFYFKKNYNSEYKYYTFDVYFDMTNANADAFDDAVSASNLYHFLYSTGFFYMDCFMDPDLKVELDIDYGDISDEEADEPEYMFCITYYHTEDIWYSAADTTDTEWNDDVVEELTYLGVDLPFVKLGEDYTCEYDSDYEELAIYDGSCDYKKLENYGQTLEDNLYVKHTDEDEGDYYTKQIDTYTDACVRFEFNGNGGNTILVSHLPREIDFYPSDKVDSFVSDTIQSIWEVPHYTQTVSGTYKYEEHANDGYWARVTIEGCSEAECLNYVNTVVAAGFEMIEEGSSSRVAGGSVVSLQKDKIYLQAVINFGSHESTESEIEEMLSYYEVYSQYSDDQIEALSDEDRAHYDLVMDEYDEYDMNGSWFDEYYFTVYDYDIVESATLTLWQSEDSIGKDPGIYAESESVTLTIGDTHQIEYKFFEMLSQEVTFTSSNESVITVDSTGIVNTLAAGKATVTVKTLDEQSQCEITFNVVPVEE